MYYTYNTVKKIIITTTKLLITLLILDVTHPILSNGMLPEDTVQTKGAGPERICRIL